MSVQTGATGAASGGQTTGEASGGTAAGGQAAGGGQTVDWTSGFNDDTKGFVQSKGFKDPASVIDSYRNLEKLMGAPKERLLRLPEKADDPSWGDIYTRLGRPADPKEYKIDVPPELGGAEALAWTREAFHKAGLSTKQADLILNEWKSSAEKSRADSQAQYQAKIEGEVNSLKKEWGAAHDQNIGLAKNAAMAFGVSPEAIDKLETAMGYSGVMKFFHQVGSKMGEHNFVSAQTKGGNFEVMTPEQAQHKINALRADNEFVRKYTNGDIGAKEEMARLHAWAYPD